MPSQKTMSVDQVRALFGKKPTGNTLPLIRDTRDDCGSTPKPKKSSHWSPEEKQWLYDNYATAGKKACAEFLGRTISAVRYQASMMSLKIDTSSAFYVEFQSRAAQSKRGKKRPHQAEINRRTAAAGKMKKTPQQIAALSGKQKQWVKEHGHPRGMLGKKHTPEVVAKLTEQNRHRWAAFSDEKRQEILLKSAKTRVAKGNAIRPRGSWKSAWRTIGAHKAFFRSRWEANYARYLEWLLSIGEIANWEHEPETFWFENVKRGTVSYLPDFRVTNKDGSIEYHEVKGWMDDRSKTKIRRMAKYHPTVTLIVIDSPAYKRLSKQVSSAIKDWE